MTAAPAQTVHPETLVLHGGNYRADPATGAVLPPIYQTTSYQFRDSAHATRLFAMEEDGYAYTRLANPTHDALESRVARLEGGNAALCLASGQAARTYALLNLTQAGDNIVAAGDIQDTTALAQSLARFGVELRPADPANFARATDKRTKAYFAETLGWPGPALFPIDEVAAIGRDQGVPLIVDNTLAPVVCRPIAHGAAVVVHAATSYLAGHGTTEGGLIVDGGNFPWEAHKSRFPLLTAPDESYHGAIWTDVAAPLGSIAFVLRVRARLLRDFGAAMTPLGAFQILQGLETLALRIRQHNANALLVADYLSGHPMIRRVDYPGLEGSRSRLQSERLLTGGYGGLVGIVLKDGQTADGFVRHLRLLRAADTAGEVRSLVLHADGPDGGGLHRQFLRISVGLEHPDDIINDLGQALEKAR